MPFETLEIDGRPVRLWRGGSGPPLVLLHGGMGDAALHWSPIWARLAERYEVIAPDLPGFGGSRALTRATFPNLVAWLDGLIDALAVGSVRLVGDDFGAALARAYAAAHPIRCDALVLINGGALPNWFERLRARLAIGGGLSRANPTQLFSHDRLSQMVADPTILTADFVAACQSTAAIAAMTRQSAQGPAPARTPGVHTLVLWGTEDRLAPPEAGRRIAAQLPRAAFRLAPGRGRLPQVEAPEETASILMAFLG